MKSSGRRNPCPVCGRDKDDKCRWNDELILCWQGDTFSPPPNLRKGETLEVPGRGLMAVLGVDAGVGGSSLLLGPHDGSQRPLVWREKPEEVARWEEAAYPVVGKLRRKLFLLQHLPDFDVLKTKEIQGMKLAISLCYAYIAEIEKFTEGVPLRHPKVRQMRKLLLDSRRQLTYVSHSLNCFTKNELGERSPIEAIAEYDGEG